MDGPAKIGNAPIRVVTTQIDFFTKLKNESILSEKQIVFLDCFLENNTPELSLEEVPILRDLKNKLQENSTTKILQNKICLVKLNEVILNIDTLLGEMSPPSIDTKTPNDLSGSLGVSTMTGHEHLSADGHSVLQQVQQLPVQTSQLTIGNMEASTEVDTEATIKEEFKEELSSSITIEDISDFTTLIIGLASEDDFKEGPNIGSKKFTINCIKNKELENYSLLLNKLLEETPSEEILVEFAKLRGLTTRQAASLSTEEFQRQVEGAKNKFEQELLISYDTNPTLVRENNSELEVNVINSLTSLQTVKKESINDLITRCFDECDDHYKQTGEIGEKWKPLINSLKVNLNSKFITDHTRFKSTLSMKEDESPYLKKSGEHEFVQTQHRVENFLLSIGQHPNRTGYQPFTQPEDGDKVSFNDVFNALRVDTASLMFYANPSNPQLNDKQEVYITGGGHPGAALEKRVGARLEEKKAVAASQERSSISSANQFVTGSPQFHDALTHVFTEVSNPLELTQNLKQVFLDHCYNGVHTSAQITDNRRILHISGHRLHSHSLLVRESFADEMLSKHKDIIKIFDDLLYKMGDSPTDIEYTVIRSERSRKSSETSNSSGSYQGTIEIK